jgi:hypothetical protein
MQLRQVKVAKLDNNIFDTEISSSPIKMGVKSFSEM